MIAAALVAAGASAEEPATVLFGTDRAAFEATGIDTLSRAAAAARRDGSGAVLVTGHADRAGDARYNDDLALRRARSVEQDLIVRGVPRAAIAVETRGEGAPAVQTADGVAEGANRRVVVTLSAPGAHPPPDPLTPFSFPTP
jgi:outer membrane protein OmpA-like peptidoglycan-associated protein